MIIGAPKEDTGANNAGSVYLFDGSLDGTNGSLQLTFTNPSPGNSNNFGWSVAGVGSNVLIGAPQNDPGGTSNAGTAYLYNGSTGSLIQTFTSSSPSNKDNLGWSVAGVGSDILVGMPNEDLPGNNDAGAALLFNSSGTLLQTLTNPTAGKKDHLGWSVAGVGSNILVGVPDEDEATGANQAGSALLFNNSGAFLQTYDNPTPEGDDKFGYSVAGVGSNIPCVILWHKLAAI